MNGKENRSDLHHFMTDAEGNKRTLVDTRGDNKKLAKPYALGNALKDEQIHNQEHLTKHLNTVKSEHDTNGHWHDSEKGQDGSSWFAKMSKEAQEEYKRKHPHAKVDHVDTSDMFHSEKFVHHNKDRVGKSAVDHDKQEIPDSKVLSSHPAQNANSSGHVEVAYKKPNGDVHLVDHHRVGGSNNTRVISADAMQHLKSM